MKEVFQCIMTTGSTVRNTLKWTSAFLLWQDTGHKRHPRSLPPIGHHPFWRKNMIQPNNRSSKNKSLSNIQQAQFSIGWRFCPVCGHKLYQKAELCSGTIRIKCLKCGNVATVDLAYRRRWSFYRQNTILKIGCIAPWIWTVRHRAAGHCRKAMNETRSK